MNAVSIRQDIIVPKPQYLESLCVQISIALFVTDRVRMLTTVDLDDEPRLETNEIDDIAIDGLLPSEDPAFQTFTSE